MAGITQLNLFWTPVLKKRGDIGKLNMPWCVTQHCSYFAKVLARVHMISCRSPKTVLRSHLCCTLSITGRDARHWISGSEEICCRQQLTRRSRRSRRRRSGAGGRGGGGYHLELRLNFRQELTKRIPLIAADTHTHTHCSEGGYHLELKLGFRQLQLRIPLKSQLQTADKNAHRFSAGNS